MPWEDTTKTHIEMLIENKNWQEAYNCLLAYENKYGKDNWSDSLLALVKCKL